MKRINVIVVDDHPVLREGIELVLRSAKFASIQVTAVSNGIQAVAAFQEKRPDLILTDLRMPHMDGIELTRVIRKVDKKIPILMVTVLSRAESISRAVKYGISGYVTKLSDPEEMLIAVKSLIDGKKYFSSEVSEALLNGQESSTQTNGTPLTSREREILLLISKDFSQAQMAKELSLSPRTIEGHARNLRTKLQAKTSVGLIMNAMQRGLLD